MEKERSSGFIIFRKNPKPEFLVLHYEEGHWDFPKGKLEKNETPLQAAFRELEEETSISRKDARIIPGFRHKIDYFFRRKGKPVFKEVDFFLAQTDAKKVILSKEHIAFKWLPFNKSLSRLTFENAKNSLKKASAFISGKKPSAAKKAGKKPAERKKRAGKN